MFGDGLRLGLGLLTIVPVGMPRVEPRTARAAMATAPGVGLLLAGVLLAGGWLGWRLGLSPLVIAVCGTGVLAVLTRGLHLDGLADTADGLGSGRSSAGAREVMKRSDIGPFGVVTLVVMVLLQVSCAAQLVAQGDGVAAVLAAVVGRAALPPACARGVRAATTSGLGASVAESVPVPLAAASVALSAVVVTALAGAAGTPWTAVTAAVALAATAAAALLRHCVTRFGGVTGDVLGALVETTQTAYLLALSGAT